MNVKTKICGITKKSEIDCLIENEADFAGFVVFVEKSKRNISIDFAGELIKYLKEKSKNIRAVAVVISPTLMQLEAIEEAGFDIIQVHGELKKEVTDKCNIPIWRAINLSKNKDTDDTILEEVKNKKVEAVLFDGENPGSGEKFLWDNLKSDFKDLGKWVIIAGGLTMENVEEAISYLKPDVVDVSTGVEYREEIFKGKDPKKIKEFIKRVKSKRKKERDMNKKAYYGQYGGQYVAESLMNTLNELDMAYEEAIKDEKFIEEYNYYLRDYVGRENPLYFAERLSEKYGTKIYLKREDLNHTGAHKINNVIGQILLAKRMGKTKVIAETGAGQHGVATATGAALFNMECTVYMGKEDIERQALNVFRMKMLGAKVVSVETGSATLKDATNEAIRAWARESEDTFYVIGSAVGPHPYPKMVKEFQSVISREARRQILEKEGRLPDAVVACVGGGSNSIGMFAEFMDDKDVRLVGVEAAGLGIETGKHASAMALGEPGVLHGMKSYLLQDEDGNVMLAHSVSAGLDYPGVGPEHSYLKDSGRAEYVSITDEECMDALQELCRMEGIIPAIESAHALAHVLKMTKEMSEDEIIVMCLSGRGDKDVHTVAAYLNGEDVNK